MRLTDDEVEAIKQSAQIVFGPTVQITLFGSRVDDTRKGGDIDLYIRTQSNAGFAEKIQFLVLLEQKIGEQKIDVVFAQDPARSIELQAMQTGVLL